MNIVVFNLCLLLAWLLVSAGAWVYAGLGLGLMACGASLVALCCLAVNLAGGLFGPTSPSGDA